MAELSTAASLVSIVDIIDHCHLPLSKAKAMVLLGCSLLVGESLPTYLLLYLLCIGDPEGFHVAALACGEIWREEICSMVEMAGRTVATLFWREECTYTWQRIGRR